MTLSHDDQKSWRFFMVNISLIIVLFLTAIFLGFILRTNAVIRDQMLHTAKSHFTNIVLTRRWNAKHGGVYVKKTRDTVSNPYLADPDIVTRDGVTYTMKNPALMTREISEYAQEQGTFFYHITSLNPLNPGNGPDDFEQEALQAFESGIAEVSTTETKGASQYFRYMAPLLVEQDCMGCHQQQGYKTGDIRGGISVTFDISDIQKQMRINRYLIAGGSLLTGALLISILFFMVSRQARKLTSAYQTIAEMAVTDSLTGLYNRRYFHTALIEEIIRSKRYSRPISLLMIDIDHFKQINDTYGHQAGDHVLQEIARIIRSTTRQNDITARFGGEEIAIILPETKLPGAAECAEKIRTCIQNAVFQTDGGRELHLTVSLGASSLSHIDLDPQEEAKALIKLADDALYNAKASGRNQVVTHAP